MIDSSKMIFKQFTKTIMLITVVILMATVISSCSRNSDCPDFADIRWTRETEFDAEYIFFGKDGSFSYYCACGNSVNDADICESYEYDDESGIITLEFIEETEDAVTEIKVVSYDEAGLKLDFNGDIREFIKEEEE